MKTKTVKIHGLKYEIPNSHVNSISGPGEGRLYARMSPPNANFHLVVSETDGYSRNWQGGDAPLVIHINDVPAPGFEMFDFPEGKVVCRGDIPHFNCGLRVQDGTVGWAVLFDKVNIQNSKSIRALATETIRKYRSNANADRR